MTTGELVPCHRTHDRDDLRDSGAGVCQLTLHVPEQTAHALAERFCGVSGGALIANAHIITASCGDFHAQLSPCSLAIDRVENGVVDVLINGDDLDLGQIGKVVGVVVTRTIVPEKYSLIAQLLALVIDPAGNSEKLSAVPASFVSP